MWCGGELYDELRDEPLDPDALDAAHELERLGFDPAARAGPGAVGPGVSEGGSMIALSVRQPWAWAILHVGKDIESRPGPPAIEAASGCTRRAPSSGPRSTSYVAAVGRCHRVAHRPRC
ncbi:MAG: hypothetical protein M3313_03600 [Actinomycetota bacterium]|nr:hypothetical protein [Actinomycetota bacterium]